MKLFDFFKANTQPLFRKCSTPIKAEELGNPDKVFTILIRLKDCSIIHSSLSRVHCMAHDIFTAHVKVSELRTIDEDHNTISFSISRPLEN